MSEESNKANKPRNQGDRQNPFDMKKNKGGKPKFNYVWIYAILAVVFFVGHKVLHFPNAKQGACASFGSDST